jgi:hypothetical protein
MNPTDQQIIETMEQRGGHFVRALAECFRRADDTNFQVLHSTFWGVWLKYRAMCIQELETAARETEVIK